MTTFLRCMIPALIGCLTSIPLSAQDFVCLGRMDVAGLPPQTLPAEGAALTLQSIEHPLILEDDTPCGYIPAVYREAMRTMRERGVSLHLEIVHVYANPLPGKFIAIEVWAETNQPENLLPLFYRISRHEESTLANLDE